MKAPPLLQQQMRILEKGTRWLERSLGQCANLQSDAALDEAAYDALEALASRYARVVDILINKVLRALDDAEFLEQGSLIDTVNRAEKRGIVSMEEARVIRELRNRIVHEYEVEDLAELLADIQGLSQKLLAAIIRLQEYIKTTFDP